MARISILFGFVAIVALGCIIDEAIARDVKLVRLPKVKHEALKTLVREGKLDQAEIIRAKLFGAIQTARDKLNHLKTLKTSSDDDLRDELDLLIKPEALLKEMPAALKNGTVTARQISVFVDKEAMFYKAWKEKSYNEVVTEKEEEFMSKMGQIMMLLKKIQKNM